MNIHCPFCGKQIIHEELNKENGTSIPIKCECKANGFVTYMILKPSDKHPSKETNNIVTIQMILSV